MPGTVLLIAASPMGKGCLVDAASVLPVLAAVTPEVLSGTGTANVVELADPLEPQAVLTRLRAAATAPGPLTVYLAGQLQLDRKQRLVHLALARTTPATVRYTAFPWHWIVEELRLRTPGSTTLFVDLHADAEVWRQLAGQPLSAGPGVSVYGRIAPPAAGVRRGVAVPGYMKALATILRSGQRPGAAVLHEQVLARTGGYGDLALAWDATAPGGGVRHGDFAPAARTRPIPSPGAPPPAPRSHPPASPSPAGRAESSGAGPAENGTPEPEGNSLTGPAENGLPGPGGNSLPGPEGAGLPVPVAQGLPGAVAGASALSAANNRPVLVVRAPGAGAHAASETLAKSLPAPAVDGSSGPAVNRWPGPEADGASGPAVARSSGPEMDGSSGPAVTRPSGPEADGASGPAVARLDGSSGPEMDRASGTPAVGSSGPVVGGSSEGPVERLSGAVAVADPHGAIAVAVEAGRHGEADELAARWEQGALREFGDGSEEVLHWREVRADLAMFAGDPAGSCEAWMGVARARLAAGRPAQDPMVESAVDRAHHQWGLVADAGRAGELGVALVELRGRVPGRRPGALEHARQHLAELRQRLAELRSAQHVPG
ncbi:hypothetical protein OG889_21520 [Streptomyces sp. NBC_00481]|uniref:hypothetical protein n=1 Tax=Streptomyces sp. NBC_00481 TaxID=2975755 RepID=UPI002DD89378|nr:hypothetical protein [Streptomyces sp. NBC_00481]WRY97083.1 hypothetical protein OG889_21520 [Streptomyces sp. NBC_00481]